MPAITVSREYGSGGSRIAQEAAQALGYHFVDKNMIEEIVRQYGLAYFDEDYVALPGFWDQFTARGERRSYMMDILRRVTNAIAHHGNVVMLGRGCYGALAGFADVLNVRIQAPLPVRIKWAVENENFADAESAEVFVKETEAVRTSFVKDCYGLPLDDAGLFDLVIGTDKVPAEIATRWLVEAASALASRVSGAERTTASLRVDPVIARVVSGVLECGLAHR